jgi:hypothetical protein
MSWFRDAAKNYKSTTLLLRMLHVVLVKGCGYVRNLDLPKPLYRKLVILGICSRGCNL